jgi:hypothetical protein
MTAISGRKESKPSDFRLKHDSDRNLSKYRARVVAKGFTQQFGIYYIETFASVAKLASIRTAIALTNDWELHCQMDIKSAYLFFMSRRQRVIGSLVFG